MFFIYGVLEYIAVSMRNYIFIKGLTLWYFNAK